MNLRSADKYMLAQRFASVERSRSTPSRAYISDWRKAGSDRHTSPPAHAPAVPARKAALDSARWRGSFDNALALLAGKLRPHVANDLEVGRDVLQHLGHILAEVAQRAAAIGAAVLFWMVRYDFAWKMRGQRLARWAGLESRFSFYGRCLYVFSSRSLICLYFFELQLELLNLNNDLLTLRAEDHAAQLLDDQLKMLNLLGV
jgi:hypothetical protein